MIGNNRDRDMVEIKIKVMVIRVTVMKIKQMEIKDLGEIKEIMVTKMDGEGKIIMVGVIIKVITIKMVGETKIILTVDGKSKITITMAGEMKVIIKREFLSHDMVQAPQIKVMGQGQIMGVIIQAMDGDDLKLNKNEDNCCFYFFWGCLS